MTEPQPAQPRPSSGAEQKLERYRRRRSEVLGGATGVARARLEALLDPGSFVELDLFVTDTAVTGTGAIDGRPVAVYALEPAPAGQAGEVTARKVAKVHDLALRSRIPIIGIEGGRAAAGEDLPALAGWADVLARQARASGIIPQLGVVVGPDAGDWPALCDFVLAAGGSGPGAGAADFPTADEVGCWAAVRRLLAHLPTSSADLPPVRPAAEEPDPAEAGPPEAPGPLAMREVVAGLLDEHQLLEMQPGIAAGVLAGLGRLGGHPVGVVASQPVAPGGAVDAAAAAKAARLVRRCDAFNVPVVSLVDTSGFAPGAARTAGADLLAAYAGATVPRLAVIVGGAPGSGYWLAPARQLGGDLCLAWPSAQIGDGDPYAAAERGYVDRVVEPRETRRELVSGIRLCLRRVRPPLGPPGGAAP